MTKLDDLLADRPAPAEFAHRYLVYLSSVLARISRDEIAAFIETLSAARERGARIFFIGNGGSAATASHFANDLAIGTRSWDRPFQVISLTDNVAVLTAIGNDFGYSEIFTAQLKVLMKPGDVVVAISASGNSPNIIEAITWAAAHGGITVGLTGFDGGALRRLAGVAVHVPTAAGEYGPVEDAHMIFDHLVGIYLKALCHAESRVV